jgi:hypothetical protein
VTRAVALLIAAACSSPDEQPTRPFDLSVPVVLHSGIVAMIAIAPIRDAAVASPEALRQYLRRQYWFPGSSAMIYARQNLRDGFAATFLSDDPRQVHVVLQIRNVWKHCSAYIMDPTEGIGDPAESAEIIGYCREHAR